jgi:hypothetical protein
LIKRKERISPTNVSLSASWDTPSIFIEAKVKRDGTHGNDNITVGNGTAAASEAYGWIYGFRIWSNLSGEENKDNGIEYGYNILGTTDTNPESNGHTWTSTAYGNWLIDCGDSGTYTGDRGLDGIHVKLTGPWANLYNISYRVWFYYRGFTRDGSNWDFAGDVSSSVNGIAIWLGKK